MKRIALVFENIVFRRGAFRMSADIRIPPGLLTVILGPSGSGKTTFLDLAAGFLRPESGRILEEGTDITGVPPEKRRFGVVFQDFALFPHMSVLRNVAFGLRARGMTRTEARRIARDSLSLVHLERYAHRHPSSLSGGEKQRVALARALAIDPDLLLLDEPFSALDAALRRELRTEVSRIQRKTGITTILVTHDQDEALALADHLVVMNEGRIVQQGRPSALWSAPEDLFTAVFLGRATRLEIKSFRRRDDGRLTVETAIGPVIVDSRGVDSLPATVMIRPENLIIDVEGDLRAVVGDAEYAGSRWRLHLDAPGGSSADTIECFCDDGNVPVDGETVRLSVRPGGAVWIPGSISSES